MTDNSLQLKMSV